jgi:hypothetical protein
MLAVLRTECGSCHLASPRSQNLNFLINQRCQTTKERPAFRLRISRL